MKINQVGILVLLSALFAYSSNMFSGHLPVKVTFTPTDERGESMFEKVFQIIFEASDPEHFPIFKKFRYRLLGFQRVEGVYNQEGIYPELTRLFIPEGQDKFVFDLAKYDEYRDMVKKILPFSNEYRWKTAVDEENDRVQSAILNLKRDLLKALYKFVRPQNEIQLKISPQDDASYDLYGSIGKDDTRKRLQDAYLAVRKFCAEIGVTIPATSSYSDISRGMLYYLMGRK